MRQTLLFVFIVVFSSNSFGQDVLSRLLHEDFSPDKFIQINKITHHEIWSYKDNSKGTIDSTLVYFYDYTYNKDGFIEKVDNYNEEDIADMKKAKPLVDKKKFVSEKYVFEYNDVGKVKKKETSFYFHGKLPIKDWSTVTEFTYDNQGNLVLDISYNPKDSVFSYSQKREYTVDSKLLRIARNSGNKFFYISHVFHYDSNGNLQKLDFMGPEKRVNYSYTFKMDTIANLKVVLVLRDNRPFHKYKFNNYLQFMEIADYDYKDDDEILQIEKLIFNPDGTINTNFKYRNGKLEFMYKHFYTK